MHKPTMASDWISTKSHTDKERWVCIYPAYINKCKTRAQGRRIPLDKAVENPSCQELRDVLAATGLTIGVENKAYSRERSNEVQFRGRIRVNLKNEDGRPINDKFPTRDSLFMYTAEMIPKLKSRMAPQKDQAQPQQATGKKGKKKNK